VTRCWHLYISPYTTSLASFKSALDAKTWHGRAGLKCESAKCESSKMTASKMNAKFLNSEKPVRKWVSNAKMKNCENRSKMRKCENDWNIPKQRWKCENNEYENEYSGLSVSYADIRCYHASAYFLSMVHGSQQCITGMFRCNPMASQAASILHFAFAYCQMDLVITLNRTTFHL